METAASANEQEYALTVPTGLPASRYCLNFKVTETLRLPEYAGSMIRGCFGRSLRRISCMTHQKDCKACPLYRTCVYTSIFEPPPEEHSLQRFTQIPSPYIIEPREWGRHIYEVGENLSFDLVLYGRARNKLPIIIYAFERGLSYRIGYGKADLTDVSVYFNSPFLQKIPLYDALSKKTLKDYSEEVRIPIWSLLDTNRVTLVFDTPLRLQNNGVPLKEEELTAKALLNALFRRWGLLQEFYTTDPFHWDYQVISQLNEQSKIETDMHWQDWCRFSSRQKQKMILGGLVGTCKLTITHPLQAAALYAGQWIHVGKNSSFGLGRFHIKEIR